MSSTGRAAATFYEASCAQARAAGAKLLHIVRHAEGTHNVNREYRLDINFDAPLTALGRQQCAELAQRTSAVDIEVVVSSPLTRTLQTAQLSFPAALERGVPFIAEESVRETVNYCCDRRRDVSALRKDFPAVDFSRIGSDADPVWAKYERVYGDQKQFSGHRESDDFEHLAVRARAVFDFLATRPERSIAVVSHNAFLTHVFNSDLGGIVEFGDDAVRRYLQRPWENCELRTVSVALPAPAAM